MDKIKDLNALKGMSESDLSTEYKAVDTEINTILNEIGDSNAPAETKLSDITALENYLDQISSVVEEKRESGANLKGAQERAAQRAKQLGTPTHRPNQKGNPSDLNAQRTLGGTFVKELEGYLSSVKSDDGKVREHQQIQSPSVAAKHLLKSLVTGASSTSGGAFVVNDRSPVVTDRDPFATLTLRDLITVGETSTDAVDIAVITGHTNNAAPVAEATDSAGTTGTPAESAIAAALETANVKDISHYIAVSKRAIADAGQVKTYVDTFLLNGLGVKLENQILNGDGTGENLLGIFNTPNIGAQAFDTDIFVSTRKARTKLTKAQVQPNAIIMNPSAWEAFELSKDGNGQFRFGGPSVLGNARLWGSTVIENQSMPDNKAIFADFRYAMLWDRMVAELTMSDSPSNFFLRKLVAIMGSLRAAFAVLYPKAFVVVDLVAP